MIRKMLPEDYEEVCKLGENLHSNFSQYYSFDDIKAAKYFNISVYLQNNQVLGFLSYTKIVGNIDISDLVVDPKYRRKKIATYLLDDLITNSNVEDKIFLEVRVSNEPAIELYKKFGFKIVNVRKNYYRSEDAYVMERVKEDE